MRQRFISAGIALIAAVIVAAPAFAADGDTTTCNETLAAGSYGRVVVPAGATCIIEEGPLTIRGGLFVEEGAVFVFGSEEAPDVSASISGGVHATNAASVQIHFSTVNGGVDIQGGAGPFGGPFEVTWDTIEDSTINGGVNFEGYNGFWSGFIRNNVNGSVNFNNNTVLDPDGNEVVTNTIHGSLNCSGNEPPPQIGDSEGSLNVVTGAKTGQCVNV